MELKRKTKVRKCHASFYLSEQSKQRIKKMAKEFGITQSSVLDGLVEFGNGNIVNLKAWVEGMDK